MKIFKKFINEIFNNSEKKAFFAAVKCSECGEEVRVRINHSSDFQVEYDSPNPNHRYTVKKEIIGKDCYNLMGLTLALSKDIQVLFFDAKGCEFIEFDRE